MTSRLEALRQALEESLETVEELIAEEQEFSYMDAYLLEEELIVPSTPEGTHAVSR